MVFVSQTSGSPPYLKHDLCLTFDSILTAVSNFRWNLHALLSKTLIFNFRAAAVAVILALGQRQPGAHDGQLQCRQVRGKSQARLHGQSGRCPSLKFRITATGMPGRQNPSQYLMMACSPSIRAHGRTRCQPEAYSQWQRSRCPGHRGPGQASILSVTAAVTIDRHVSFITIGKKAGFLRMG